MYAEVREPTQYVDWTAESLALGSTVGAWVADLPGGGRIGGFNPAMIRANHCRMERLNAWAALALRGDCHCATLTVPEFDALLTDRRN